MWARLSFVYGISITLAAGCAELHAGAYAVPVDRAGRFAPAAGLRSGLRISGRQVTALSSRYFGAIEVTFENLSPAWVRIQQASIDFGTPARNAEVAITAGEDLQRWQEGTQRRNAIRDANRETALDLLLFGAAVATAAAGRSPVGAGAALVGAGAAGTLAADQLAERNAAAETVALYPATHLLSLPFSVPPGLAIKRWIVLNTGATKGRSCIRHADLEYVTDSHLRERVRLAFSDLQSEWQTPICPASDLTPAQPHTRNGS
jgi:hypothetical protein